MLLGKYLLCLSFSLCQVTIHDYLGAPVKDVPHQDLFPAVGLLSTSAEISTNFGQMQFAFNIAEYIRVRGIVFLIAYGIDLVLGSKSSA